MTPPGPPSPDAPSTRAPERAGTTIGSRLYNVAAPLVGKQHASELAAFAKLVDAAPAVQEELTRLFAPQPASQPNASPPGSRVLAAAAFAFVFAATLAGAWMVYSEFRSLREEQVLAERRSQERHGALQADVARAQGKADATETATKSLRSEVDELSRAQLEDARTVAILTKHVLARLDAIGESTGADKMDSWTPTPPELALVVVQQEVAARRPAGG
jgi:hypothetical protein